MTTSAIAAARIPFNVALSLKLALVTNTFDRSGSGRLGRASYSFARGGLV
jgi:hypothetical protein